MRNFYTIPVSVAVEPIIIYFNLESQTNSCRKKSVRWFAYLFSLSLSSLTNPVASRFLKLHSLLHTATGRHNCAAYFESASSGYLL
jgi:hypothetical protein